MDSRWADLDNDRDNGRDQRGYGGHGGYGGGYGGHGGYGNRDYGRNDRYGMKRTSYAISKCHFR